MVQLVPEIMSSMVIFLRRIPAETKKEDIFEFIEPVLKGGLFKKSGYITHINILILRDTVINKNEHHALVTVEPDSVAKRVIEKLNRKPIRGKHIALHEYVYRLWHNDPRTHRKRWSSRHEERRQSDRRRGSKLEVVKTIDMEL
jgi:hypothetical protein